MECSSNECFKKNETCLLVYHFLLTICPLLFSAQARVYAVRKWNWIKQVDWFISLSSKPSVFLSLVFRNFLVYFILLKIFTRWAFHSEPFIWKVILRLISDNWKLYFSLNIFHNRLVHYSIDFIRIGNVYY